MNNLTNNQTTKQQKNKKTKKQKTMKKKTYEIPSMNVIAVKPASIICGSDNNSINSLRSGSWGSGNEPQTDDDGYYLGD